MKVASAAIYFVLAAPAVISDAEAFAVYTKTSPLASGGTCRSHSSTRMHYTGPDATDADDSSATDSRESVFKGLNDLAELKYDPEDHESDKKETEEILELSLTIVEQLQHSTKAVDILKEEALSDEGLHSDDPVSRKKVTTQTNESKRCNILSYKIPAANKNRILIDDNKLKEMASREFGPAVSLLKALKQDKVASSYSDIGYATYPPHPEFPDVDLSGMPKMMYRGQLTPTVPRPPPREYIFAPKKLVRILRRVINNQVGLARTKDAVDKATAEKMYDAIFTKSKIFGFIPNPLNLVPSPDHVVKHWEEDTELARQYLNGVNPVMIKVAESLDDIATPLLKKLGAERLQELVDTKRLFYVNYDELDELKVNPHQAYPLPMNEDAEQDQPRHFYPAKAAFILSKDRKDLDVLGIQLEHAADAQVYTKNESTEGEWMFAKASLATADSQYHEWVSHLGMTHFAVEPHIIAIHNTLRKHKHPVHAFVKPLCKDTLLLNWAARLTLASSGENSFGDFVTSVGTGQFLQLIQKNWQRYDFFKSSGLPSELASRGFTEDFDMPEYLYRADGMKLWNAYGDFAADFVNELYVSDGDVAKDKVLQIWARETTDPERGAVPGFPKSFADRSTLVKTLQTLMWMTSGLHAAVNFPQYDFYAYGPNKPLGARAGLKQYLSSGDNTSDKDWLCSDFMPLMDTQETVISTVHLLTLPSDHCMDNLTKEFENIGNRSYETFQARLDAIGDEIEARNKANKNQGKAIYAYLHPSLVPASIDI